MECVRRMFCQLTGQLTFLRHKGIIGDHNEAKRRAERVRKTFRYMQQIIDYIDCTFYADMKQATPKRFLRIFSANQSKDRGQKKKKKKICNIIFVLTSITNNTHCMIDVDVILLRIIISILGRLLSIVVIILFQAYVRCIYNSFQNIFTFILHIYPVHLSRLLLIYSSTGLFPALL